MSAHAELERYLRDPVACCRELFGFEPWSKQREILEALRDHDRVAVRSAHAVGKTATAARAVLWWLTGGPGSIVVTTAPTERQVKKLLWREVKRGFHASGGFFDGTLTDLGLDLAPDWFAQGLSTDDPDSFQGWHGERVLVVVDEAAGVDEEIYEAIEGVLAGGESKLLLIGNPTRTSGQFFRAFHSERALWKTIRVSALDAPAFSGERVPAETARRLVTKRWVEDKRVKWGEGSLLWSVRVLGEFARSGEDSVCSLAEVEEAQERELVPSLPGVVAVDVARFGSDETVIATREGGVVRIPVAYVGKNTMRTVGEVLRVARRLCAGKTWRPVIVVDDVGVGGGVTDRLRELAEFRVVAFNGANRPRQPREYPTRRSESWFDLAERLGELDLPLADEQLVADLVAPRFTIDSRGRRVVEPKEQTKKRLGRSPGRGDAVVMAMAVGDNVQSGSSSSAGVSTDEHGEAGLHGADALRVRRSRSGSQPRWLPPGSTL